VHLVRNGLYDLNEFISLRDARIKSIKVPDMEIHQLAKDTMELRHLRPTMAEVIQ
jgi:hypothetical protein